MRPILRPGTHVLTRAAGELQVGLDPRSALVLPDSDEVRHSLALLAASAERGDHTHPATLSLLEQHGLILDERALAPERGRGGVAATAGAALARAAGSEAPALRRARGGFATDVVAFGHPAGAHLRGELVDLVAAAGLPRPRTRSSAAAAEAAAAGVLLGVGEPDRELVDAWTRAGTPYLVLRLTEGRAVIGPFVVPGRTACLRCIDAHHTDADPAWPLLVRQYAAACRRDRADGAPEPVDPLLATLAVAWAARDLTAYADGGRPSTWSTTVTLDARPDRLETQAWLRHPGCGCSWD
jgi:bacteriocin biosynthesis cyclodehydratase domain-containing protein